MKLGSRWRRAMAAFSGESAVAGDAAKAIEAQLAEVSRRLDSLQQQLWSFAPLSPEEARRLERSRLEQNMLADWPGAARDELAARIRALLSKLRPMQAVGRQKARF